MRNFAACLDQKCRGTLSIVLGQTMPLLTVCTATLQPANGSIGSVQAQAGGAGGSAWARLPELLLALLHLMLDPAACHLTLDLQVPFDPHCLSDLT